MTVPAQQEITWQRGSFCVFLALQHKASALGILSPFVECLVSSCRQALIEVESLASIIYKGDEPYLLYISFMSYRYKTVKKFVCIIHEEMHICGTDRWDFLVYPQNQIRILLSYKDLKAQTEDKDRLLVCVLQNYRQVQV